MPDKMYEMYTLEYDLSAQTQKKGKNISLIWRRENESVQKYKN